MDAVNALIKPIHEAFQEIFPPKTGEQIHSIAQWLDETTKKLIITDDSAKKIKAVAEGVFSVLRVGKDILEGIFLAVGKIVTAAKPIGDAFLDAASSVGKFAAEIANGLHPLETISTWATKFVDAAAPALYSFGSVADKVLTSFAEGAKNAFNEFDPEKLNQFILGGMGASMLVSIKGFLDSFKSIDSGIDSVRCSASIGSSYVLFRVGIAALPPFTINAYDASLTKRSVTVPNRDSYEMAAASSENYAIFADRYYVVAYNDSLTCSMMTPLSDERVEGAAATVGNYVLFAGGLNSGKKDIVDVYTID